MKRTERSSPRSQSSTIFDTICANSVRHSTAANDLWTRFSVMMLSYCNTVWRTLWEICGLFWEECHRSQLATTITLHGKTYLDIVNIPAGVKVCRTDCIRTMSSQWRSRASSTGMRTISYVTSQLQALTKSAQQSRFRSISHRGSSRGHYKTASCSIRRSETYHRHGSH